jgi:uncharacterized protein (TIGR03437 family)
MFVFPAAPGSRAAWQQWMVRGVVPFLVLTFAATLEAAPKLRLTSASVGPVSVNQGASPAAQTVEAYNAGDGNLSLAVSTTVDWLTAAVGGSRPCSLREGNCLPVNITFNTTALATGTYTGFVNVGDPNALDAPQTISVTVQVGGAVPSEARLYVAPNGSTDELRFSTNSMLTPQATTESGGPWLSLALEGTGSFRFNFPYRIMARHLEDMPEGTYTGALAISGSSTAAENKTVNVTLQVTSEPIARASSQRLTFRVATGAAPQRQVLVINNSGLGTLAVSGASATAETGGSWLAAESGANNTVTVTADISGVSVGNYTGTVTVNSNAANASLTIPVTLSVVEPGPPFAAFGGVLNSANFDNGFAPGSVAAVFGEQFSNQPAGSGTTVPLVTELNGVRVLVNDEPAPLYFTSYNQVNFQIPYSAAVGDAVVRVEREGQAGNPLSIEIEARAPRIIQVGDSGVIVRPNGSLAMRGGSPARPGEALTIYAVGLGATSPAATTGAGSPAQEPLARVTPAPLVVMGNAFTGATYITPLYAGLTPGLVGLYQVNFIVPADTPEAEIRLWLEGDDYRSNTVLLPVVQ